VVSEKNSAPSGMKSTPIRVKSGTQRSESGGGNTRRNIARLEPYEVEKSLRAIKLDGVYICLKGEHTLGGVGYSRMNSIPAL
jgi:hypothetical protein